MVNRKPPYKDDPRRSPPLSKGQARAFRVFGESNHPKTYYRAASVLEEKGLPRNGVPVGHNWRSVKAMSDKELLPLLKTDMVTRRLLGLETKRKKKR